TRGFSCGPKEKAQGPGTQLNLQNDDHQTPAVISVPRSPPMPSDEVVTPADFVYLQVLSDYGYTLESPGIREWLVTCGGNLLESKGIVSCHAPIATFPIASKLYRFGCLAFA